MQHFETLGIIVHDYKLHVHEFQIFRNLSYMCLFAFAFMYLISYNRYSFYVYYYKSAIVLKDILIFIFFMFFYTPQWFVFMDNYSYCSRAPIFCILARFEGIKIFILERIANNKYSNHHQIHHLITYNLNIWFQDHMRKAGDVCFAEVSRDSEGTH